MKTEEIKAELILMKVRQSEIAEKVGINKTQISNIINHGPLVREYFINVLGFDLFPSKTKKKE